MERTEPLSWLTASELLDAYRSRSLSPVEVISDIEARIERYEPTLNAFPFLALDEARDAARASEARWQAGKPDGALDGVPVTIKDTVDAKGWPTRKASLLTPEDHRAQADAPAVAHLREAGAVLFAKTAVPEFAWKAMTDSRLHGITRNPWDPERTPAGSTGGGTAAVAAGIGHLAHGTDGGGSLRMPPSFCGVVGLKPTHGRVPYVPQLGPAASLVVEGPVARSVRDIALAINEMKKPDPRDPLCLPYDPSDWSLALDTPLAGIRIAYSPGFAGAEPPRRTLAVMQEAVAVFRSLGATVDEVGPVITPLKPRFEAHWLASLGQVLRAIPEDRRDLLDPMLRQLCEQGLPLGPEPVWEGLNERQVLGQEMAEFHRDYPLLITPTMLDIAPPVTTVYHSPAFDRWDATVYTMTANLTGQPALSVPAGLADGLPIGLQIMGPRFAERQILAAGHAFEQVRGRLVPHPLLLQSLERMSRS
ncbi:aspartyl-tRNA(Asn)/glutamyl-tRNA(Gln) amidotransferase subunit A [Rhodoligotrophos appendicifer]|uniref:amidase family protein n=1 Tax=Rhodoligotrophos appendicifer TaxID=987056 RepID=UPI0014786407|nr:amidase family protein [Rhodoligotrophos appendicifer]